jgi:hypothetical protein
VSRDVLDPESSGLGPLSNTYVMYTYPLLAKSGSKASPPEAAVVEGVYLRRQIDERRGKQHPVLDHSDDPVLLPDEQPTVRG